MSKKWVDVSKVGEIASRGKSYTDSLVGSLSTITQNAISELDETKQEKFDGAPGMLAAFDEIGDPTSIPLWSNENLLRNADFRYPENQNGMETYVVSSTTEAIPCLDDWWLIGHGSLVVEDGYIRLVPSSSGSYVTMYQDVPLSKPLHIIGNPVTVSMFGTGPMAASFAGYDPSDAWETVLGWSSLIAPANSPLTDSEKLHTRTYYDFDGLNHDYFLRVRFSAMLTNGEARYTAVKLERGSIGTLAYRKATGDWMLNTVMPSYAETPDNLIVTGEPGKMAVYDENGELSSFSGNAGDLVTLDQNGNPKSTPADEIIPSGNVRINHNIIPNWNFLTLVNSGGKTSYPVGGSGVKTAMDGWMIPNGSIYLAKNGSTNYFYARYIISSKTDAATPKTVLETGWFNPPGYAPASITLSFIVQNIEQGSVRASLVFSGGSKYSTEVADASEWAGSSLNALLTVTVPNPPKELVKVIIEHKDGTGLHCRPIYIKLEEGTQQTLVYKFSNGIWAPYIQNVNELKAWTDANGRVPVGKNLLVNADFEHLYNPLGLSDFPYGCDPNGWSIRNTGVCVNLDTNYTTATSITAPLGHGTETDLMWQNVDMLPKTGDIYTLSIECYETSVELPVVSAYVGSTVVGSITPTTYNNKFAQVTFAIPNLSSNGDSRLKVSIRSHSSHTVFNYGIKKIKLEVGPVETLSREVDRSDPPIFMSMLPTVINPNILVNGDFTNFINESGKTTFAFEGSSITNCCWSQRGNGTITYANGVASWTWTSANAYLGQRVLFPNNTATRGVFSVVYATQSSDTTGSSGVKLIIVNKSDNMEWKSPVLRCTGGKPRIATFVFNPGVFSNKYCDFGVCTDSPQNVGTQITREYIRNSVTTTFYAMKVEEGPISTLARTFYPNSVSIDLYGTAFDPVTELARVRSRERYLVPMVFTDAYKASDIYWYSFLPFSMRVIPSLSEANRFRLLGYGEAMESIDLAATGNIIQVSLKTSFGAKGDNSLLYVTGGNPVKLDANP